MAEEIEVAYGHRRFGSEGRGGIISAEVEEKRQTFLRTALVISLGEHIHAFSGELGSELDSACGHDVELVDHAGVVGIGAEGPGTLNISLGKRREPLRKNGVLRAGREGDADGCCRD